MTGIKLGKGNKNIVLGDGAKLLQLGSSTKSIQLDEGIKKINLTRPVTDMVLASQPAQRVGFSYEWTLQDQDYGKITVEKNGTISEETLTNVVSYDIYLNSVLVTLPFDVVELDLLEIINVVKTAPASDAVVKLTCPSWNQEDDTVYSPPIPDEARKHLFILHPIVANVDAASSYLLVVDTSTDTIIDDVQLPDIFDGSNLRGWVSIWYDSNRDLIGCMNGAHICFIEANPDSPNFLDFVDKDHVLHTYDYATSPATFYRSSQGTSYGWYNSVYDPQHDLLYNFHHAYNYLYVVQIGELAFGPTNNTGARSFIPHTGGGFGHGVYLPDGEMGIIDCLGGYYKTRKYKDDPVSNDYPYNWTVRKGYMLQTSRYTNGTLLYIPEYNIYVSMFGQMRATYQEDFHTKINYGSKPGAGTSSYYQSHNIGDYSPHYKIVMAPTYFRINLTNTYEHFNFVNVKDGYDSLGDWFYLDDNINYANRQTIYSHHSKKFYSLTDPRYRTGAYKPFLRVSDPAIYIAAGGNDKAANHVHIKDFDLDALGYDFETDFWALTVNLRMVMNTSQVVPSNVAYIDPPAIEVLHIDAFTDDDITYESSGSTKIAQIDDVSGLDRHMGQLVTANQPDYDSVNKGIDFGGITDEFFLRGEWLGCVPKDDVLGKGTEFFIVVTFNSIPVGGAYQYILSLLPIASSLMYIKTGGDTEWYYGPTELIQNITTPGTYLINAVFPDDGYTYDQELNLGIKNYDEVLTYPFDGLIHELIQYNKQPTSAVRSALITSLNTKWGT